jgi:hypothetical protein
MDRDLELQALQDTRRRIAALESLLDDLPKLFESRFRQQLLPKRGSLRGRFSPLRLLPRPPSLSGTDVGALPTAVSADPTRR